MRATSVEPDPELAAALTAARVAVADLMLFVGVDPEEARAATREEPRMQAELEVRAPASTKKERWSRRGRRRT